MSQRTKIYFASDFHLGVPTQEASRKREQHIVSWLDEIKADAQVIYLVGDIFDFWFEYKRAIPKGFVRLQGKLAELTDSGIEIHWFTGNHDMWIFDYIPKELGVILHRKPVVHSYFGKKIYIGHGDGLGPGDKGYKILKRLFENKFCQWAFERLHPNFGIWLANFSSRSSRASSGHKDEVFLGEQEEWLCQYSREYLKKEHIDLFVFGHRHLPLSIPLTDQSHYINLGDWLQYNTYLELDGNFEKLSLKVWPE